MARLTPFIFLALFPLALSASVGGWGVPAIDLDLCRHVKCKAGQLCAGNFYKKCVTPMKAGGRCDDAFWVCATGLDCDEGICKAPIVTVRPGDVCDGKTRVCPAPTDCNSGRCTKLLEEGGSCADPFWVCRPGLDCVGTGVDKVCENTVVTVKPGAKCDGVKRLCPAPTTCNGPTAANRRCTKEMGLNGSCVDPFWVCKTGLVCTGAGRARKCTLPTVTVKPGEKCDGTTRLCPAPTTCNGPTAANRRCTKEMGLNGSCVDPFWVCKTGLVCTGAGRARKCTLPVVTVGPGAACDGKARVCSGHMMCMRGRCQD